MNCFGSAWPKPWKRRVAPTRRSHYQLCVDKRADWMMPRVLLGKILLQLGRRAEAKTLLAAALELAMAQSHEDPERELRGLLADL